MSRWLKPLVPLLLFAAVLALMQWISDMPVTSLGLKTIGVFLVTAAALRILPWHRWILKVRPNSPLYLLVLFGLFVQHFASILAAESRRLLTARSLAVSRNYGPGSFRSLAHALTSLFTRSLDRAERFYAAQRLRGIAE